METTTELTLPQRAAVALKSAEQETALRALALSSVDIVAVVNKDGREQAHRIGMTLKNARISIEKTSKAAREDATAFGKACIAEEKRLTDIVAGEETRVFGLRDDYDAIEAKRVADAIAAERARIELITEHIEDLRRIPLRVAGGSSAGIQVELDDIKAIAITEERFGEQAYRDAAETVRAAAVAQMEAMLADAVAKEAEVARIQAEREADDKRRAEEAAELARQRVEQQRVAAEQAAAQKALDDAAAAQREALRIEADQAAAVRKAEDDERARVAAEVKAQLDAQQAEIAAAQRRLAEQQAAADARDAAERQALENAAKAAECYDEAHAENAQFDVDRAAQTPALPDTRPVITIELPAQAEEPVLEWPAPPTLRLGQISDRLGFVVTADFMAKLGFAPAATDKAAKLYHESDFKNICAALLRHIAAVSAAN